MTARELIESEEWDDGDIITPKKLWPTKRSNYSGNLDGGPEVYRHGDLFEIVGNTGEDENGEYWFEIAPFPQRKDLGDDFLIMLQDIDINKEFVRAPRPHVKKAAKHLLSGPRAR